MNINIEDVIKLSDNKEYLVTNKVQYENKSYLFLVEMGNILNNKFCFLDLINNVPHVVEVEDKELIRKLIVLMGNNIPASA